MFKLKILDPYLLLRNIIAKNEEVEQYCIDNMWIPVTDTLWHGIGQTLIQDAVLATMEGKTPNGIEKN